MPRYVRRPKQEIPDLPNEKWTKAYECPGYQVSNLGRVKSEERTMIRKNGRIQPVPQKLISSATDSRGYNQVHPYINKKRKPILVHRLIFQSFIRPLAENEQIDHINSVKTDNRLSNLQPVKSHAEHAKLTNERLYHDIYTKGYKAGFKAGYEIGQKEIKTNINYKLCLTKNVQDILIEIAKGLNSLPDTPMKERQILSKLESVYQKGYQDALDF